MGRLPESCRDVGDRLQKTLMPWRRGIDPKGHSNLACAKDFPGVRVGEELLLEFPYLSLASSECFGTRNNGASEGWACASRGKAQTCSKGFFLGYFRMVFPLLLGATVSVIPVDLPDTVLHV